MVFVLSHVFKTNVERLDNTLQESERDPVSSTVLLHAVFLENRIYLHKNKAHTVHMVQDLLSNYIDQSPVRSYHYSVYTLSL